MITILMNALDRGNDNFGQIGYKFNMRAKLREKTEGYEDNYIYSVATLLDPRSVLLPKFESIVCIFAMLLLLWPSLCIVFRFKDTYFMDVTNAEQAKTTLLTLVEAEMDSSQDDHQEERHCSSSEPPLEGQGLIISQIRKRIRLEKQEKVKVFL